MKPEPSSKQALLAREHLVHCVKRATAMLLTNVPMAMSGQPDHVRMAYAFVTAGAAALYVASGAAVWVVRVRLTA
jgi:hypothetical protein